MRKQGLSLGLVISIEGEGELLLFIFVRNVTLLENVCFTCFCIFLESGFARICNKLAPDKKISIFLFYFSYLSSLAWTFTLSKIRFFLFHVPTKLSLAH